MAKRISAWHFLKKDHKLGYGDGRKVEVGKRLQVKGDPKMCLHGLHASIKPLDALMYAPGPVACKVLVGGRIFKEDNKIVGTTREVVAMGDATEIFQKFARKVALEVLHFWDYPIHVKEYLEAGNENLAARSLWIVNSYVADSYVAGVASPAAAMAANAGAMPSRAYKSARSAAWSAARATGFGDDDIYFPYREEQNTRLELMLNEFLGV